MSFSTPIFLFMFLPICILGYWLTDKRYKNIFICIFSLAFYAWNGITFLLLVLLTTCVTFILGMKLEKCEGKKKNLYLIIGIIYSVGILFYFKYFAWFIESVAGLLPTIKFTFSEKLVPMALPLGISFYTFSVLSYIIDIYWGKCKAQKKLSNLLLYILLFPKMVMGPIMRYADFEKQLDGRPCNSTIIYQGIECFIKGIVKKIWIADNIAPIVTYAFSNAENLNTVTAWLGIVGYLLQLYFDFSGYCDMAIGLGNMMGFQLPENFDHPYMSESVAEYWRRWHSTLGDWLKDYIYMPVFRSILLKKVPFIKKQISINASDIMALFVVWVIAGVWHGAGINYILYGLWYFLFIAIERLLELRKKKLIKAKKIKKKEDTIGIRILKRVATGFAIIIGQTLFRSTGIKETVLYIKALFSMNFNGAEEVLIQMTTSVCVAMIVGIVFCFPIYEKVKTKVYSLVSDKPIVSVLVQNIYNLVLLGAYIVVILYIAGSGYAPFLYEVF